MTEEQARYNAWLKGLTGQAGTSQGAAVTEREVLLAILHRPGMMTGARNLTAVMGYICGFLDAQMIIGRPIESWSRIIELVRNNLAPEYAENALATDEVIRRLAGGDDEKAFELFAQAMQQGLETDPKLGDVPITGVSGE